MSDSYELGTLAKATVRGVTDVLVFRFRNSQGSAWVSVEPAAGWVSHSDNDIVVKRTLTILDLETGGWEPRTLAEFLRKHGAPHLAGQVLAQAKTPRIPEPELWGVVRAKIASEGRAWEFVRYPDGWTSTTTSPVPWDDLIDPVHVRDGVEL